MAKSIIIFVAVIIISVIIPYYYDPTLFIDIYRGRDEESIWVKGKFFPFKKELTGTDSYKTTEIWSPDKKHITFYDYTMQELYTKEVELKIIDLRTLRIRTIFVGTQHTSEYKWLDNEKIRVYVDAGTGVRIYRDLSINDPVFIADDNMSPINWTMEATFVRPASVIKSKENDVILV